MNTPITILYKSGIKVHVTVDKMTVKAAGGDLTRLDWTNMEPNPLHLGINNIEAIFEGTV